MPDQDFGFSEAAASATERYAQLTAEPSAEPQEPRPSPAPAGGGQQPTQAAPTQAAETPAPQPAPPPAEDLFEFEFQGERVKITPQERDAILQIGAQRYLELLRQQNEPQAPAKEPEQPAPQGQAPFSPEIVKAIEQILEQRLGPINQHISQQQAERARVEREASIAKIEQRLDAAVSSDPNLKAIAEGDFGKIVKALVIAQKSADPTGHMTLESAARKVGEVIAGFTEKQKQQFISSKVTTAQGTRTEAGRGASPVTTSEKKMGADELMNGELGEYITQKLLAQQGSGI